MDLRTTKDFSTGFTFIAPVSAHEALCVELVGETIYSIDLGAKRVEAFSICRIGINNRC